MSHRDEIAQLVQLHKAITEWNQAGKTLAAARGKVRIERYVSIRFRGQTHYLDVPIADGPFTADDFENVVEQFESQYEVLFGRGAAFSKAGFELLSVRAVGTGALPPPPFAVKGEKLEPVGRRTVVFRDPKRPVDTAIYRTGFPDSSAEVSGPAIIEFPGQSVVVPPGSVAKSDSFGNLHIKKARA